MFSIICVYNNERILKDMLLSSLYNQTSRFDLILIDNRNHKYDSAAKAFNEGALRAKRDYIMFIHQDVYLIGKNWLNKAEKLLNELSNLGAAGVAGMCEEGKTNRDRGRNLIFHGPLKKVWSWGNRISKPTEVQTLDEQVLIIPREIFMKVKFDERTCSGWHLYGVDYCLSIKRLGLKTFVLPLQVWHLSQGRSLDEDYFLTLKKICMKHEKFYDRIYTTTGDYTTSGINHELKLGLLYGLSKILNKVPLKLREIVRERLILPRIRHYYKLPSEFMPSIMIAHHKLYNEEYFATYDKGKGYEYDIWKKHFSELAETFVRKFNPKRMLDIGCAREFLVYEMRKRGVEAYGVDVSNFAIQTALSEVKDKLKRCDVTKDKLPFPSSFFDFVTCIEVIEHLENVDNLLKEVWRVLKLGGVCYVSTPTIKGYDKTHINVHNRKWWINVFKAYGSYVKEGYLFIPDVPSTSLGKLILKFGRPGKTVRRILLKALYRLNIIKIAQFTLYKRNKTSYK